MNMVFDSINCWLNDGEAGDASHIEDGRRSQEQSSCSTDM